jgi:crotonobetainyl-CoA:carnitine CoA-transferase CaiB-like acyl-CoA transferase
MTQVMKGVRVLEVAQFTFVPAAGGILADWGADVIKIEHPVRGDTQRGFLNMGGVKLDPQRHTLFEHPNRGKRSVGIDVSTPEGQAVLYELAKTADVFLTNYLPQVRQKNKFDIEHIRAVNPNIIYARGSALGNKGPEREVGGFDGTCFWSRSGVAHAMTPAEMEGPLTQGIPAFGDSIGGMFIAGGIAAALYNREKTGEGAELDVSLLSAAWWASGRAGLAGDGDRHRHSQSDADVRRIASRNPFMGNFRTSDGGTINLCMVSPTGLIRDTFEHVGVPEAGDDPALQGRAVADRERRRGQRHPGQGVRRQALCLLAQAPEDDEGPMGADPELRGSADRRTGAGQRHDHRGRRRRRRRPAAPGPRAGAV